MINNHSIQCSSHDTRFVDGKLSKFPHRFRRSIIKKYSTLYSKKSRRDANLYLLRTAEKVKGNAINLASDDNALRKRAKLCAQAVKTATSGAGHCSRGDGFAEVQPGRFVFRPIGSPDTINLDSALEWGENYAKAQDITPPDEKKYEPEGRLARLKDEHWWRGAIRKSQGRKVEGLARELDLVHKRAGIYSSEETLYRRKGQKRRNRQMLEEVIATNEEGQQYTLAELSDLSTSNPEIRRGELMLRIAGFDEIAIEADHARDFWTLTCPSRFHSHLSKSSSRNPKYDGSTPRDAQEWLSKVWQRIRAKLARDHDLTLYGFRVAEPHHDGCPHWHLLVFMPKEHLEYARGIIKKYALADSPEEDINCLYRFKAEPIHTGKSAAGYLAKYISKNISGHSVGKDLLGDDINTGMERVDAWAACWRIKQFQQLGGAPVTVWRELRRMECEEAGFLEVVRGFADKGKWKEYTQWMQAAKKGGVNIKPAYLQEIKTDTGELPLNKYGELAAGRIVGVRVDSVYHITRFNNWSIEHATQKNTGDGCGGRSAKGQRVNTDRSRGDIKLYSRGLVVDGSNRGAMADIRRLQKGELRGGEIAFMWEKSKGVAIAAPWSSVNNCTGVENAAVSEKGYGCSEADRKCFNGAKGEACAKGIVGLRGVTGSDG